MRDPQRTDPRGKRGDLAALAILALATLLSIFHLGAKSFWLDEAHSVLFARQGGASLWRLVTHGEPNMSLYFLLLHHWLAFGASEAAVRSLSAVAAALSILPFYAMCRGLFGGTHALVASGLLAVNAFFIQYAQEARSYTLVLLLVTASSALFLRALARPTAGAWIAYGVVAVLGVYAHVFAAFVIVAHTIFVLVWRRSAIRSLAIVDAGMACALVPLFVWIRTAGPAGTWIARPRLLALAGVFIELSGEGGKTLAAVYLVACALGLSFFLASKRGIGSTGARDGALFALTWLAVPILGGFAYSHLGQPIFVPRYLIVSLPPLVMIAALGVVGTKPRWIPALLLAALLVLAARSLLAWYAAPARADWREATAYVLDNGEPGDVLLFRKAYGSVPFEYYVWRRGNPPSAPRPLLPASRWGEFDVPWRPELEQDALERLKRESPARVWLVLSHNSTGEESAALDLGGGYSRLDDRSFRGVRVVLCSR